MLLAYKVNLSNLANFGARINLRKYRKVPKLKMKKSLSKVYQIENF